MTNLLSLFSKFFDKVYKYKFIIISLLLLILSLVIIADKTGIEKRIETFLPCYKPGELISEIDNPALQNEMKMSFKFGDSMNVIVIYKSPSPLDLHVLGTPPAFTLSQNQTLPANLFGFIPCFVSFSGGCYSYFNDRTPHNALIFYHFLSVLSTFCFRSYYMSLKKIG